MRLLTKGEMGDNGVSGKVGYEPGEKRPSRGVLALGVVATFLRGGERKMLFLSERGVGGRSLPRFCSPSAKGDGEGV